MSIESWMDKRLNDYLDQQDDPAGRFSFRYKLRGGWINVKASAEWEDDSDEDGRSVYLNAKIIYCHWCFNEDHEVDLTRSETDEIKEKILEIAKDI